MIKINENVLSNDLSPYLKQHKDNQVNWKIWSRETMGQTSSITLYKDIERNINKLISDFFSQWYTDNPMKQF